MDIDSLFVRAGDIASSVPGLTLSVAAVGPDGVEHAAAFGDDDDPILPSCSAFKPVVAAAVRSAAADGIVDLQAPIRHLPGGTIAPPDWDGSLDEVLAHLSGLGGDLYEIPITASTDGEAASELLGRYLPVVPKTERGRYWYSNLGYALAGHVLSQAEGDEMVSVVRRRVLAPAGAEVFTRRDALPDPADRDRVMNDALRAAGGGTLLRAIDLARVGRFLTRRDAHAPGLVRTRPVRILPTAEQHPAGGFFLDARYGRPLLVHGGGHGSHGASWVVDPVDGWSCAALFDHPVGYGLDLAASVLSRERGADPLRRRTRPQPGWYLNEYAGAAAVTSDGVRVNGAPLVGACAADGEGVAINQTPIVIGSLPYRRVSAPTGDRPAPAFVGRFVGDVDDITIELGSPPVIRSATRGTASGIALTASLLACGHGTIELDGDDVVVGGAYRFTRA